MSTTHPQTDDRSDQEDEADDRIQQLDKVRRFIELLYERKISKEFDRIILVIGDEGMGKSTFMTQFCHLWQDYRGMDPTPESVLDRVIWDERSEFKRALATSDPKSVIMVQDAARILHKQEAWDPEQRESEKDLLDSRMKEFVILLGYQDWRHVPTMLQQRRAKNAFVITARGRLKGYSREGLDHRYENGEWPDEPALRDRFPSLEGTELWTEFKTADLEHKEQRMDPDDGEPEEDDPLSPQEIADQILEEGVDEWTSIHGGNKTEYIDKDLIRADFELSHSDASTVKKLVSREVDVGGSA